MLPASLSLPAIDHKLGETTAMNDHTQRRMEGHHANHNNTRAPSARYADKGIDATCALEDDDPPSSSILEGSSGPRRKSSMSSVSSNKSHWDGDSDYNSDFFRELDELLVIQRTGLTQLPNANDVEGEEEEVESLIQTQESRADLSRSTTVFTDFSFNPSPSSSSPTSTLSSSIPSSFKRKESMDVDNIPQSEVQLPTKVRKTDASFHESGILGNKFETSRDKAQGLPTLQPLAVTTVSTEDCTIMFSKAKTSGGHHHIVSHDQKIQSMMDALRIPWSAQWEIARGTNEGRWTWQDITSEKLERLSKLGDNAACIVEEVLRPDSFMRPPPSEVEIFRELAREQKAILENIGRGFGLLGPWEGVQNWYGGKVQQVARLEEHNGSFKIRLCRLEMRKSYRFARFLGSRRIIRLRIPDNFLYRNHQAVLDFVSACLVICGRVYAPFHAKEKKVYYMETNDDYERVPSESEGDQHRLSLEQFIKWHNPLHLNYDQPISKWTSRWALGLSTSRPVLEFAAENIFFIDDEIATIDPPQGKARTEQIMTDGCGFINRPALKAIAAVFGWNEALCAVHGRIGGSKGLWILHPDPKYSDTGCPPTIWIRDSQRKVYYGGTQYHDKAQRIFDLVRLARITHPSGVSKQTILNMAYNGVPHNVFVDLMQESLQMLLKDLTDWENEHSMKILFKAICTTGGILNTRLARSSSLDKRALGFIFDEIDDEEIGDTDVPRSTELVERIQASMCPTSLFESALAMLEAGFTPLESPLLEQKISYICKTVIASYLDSYHITVPLSAEAWIVPDPYGVLEEGEIQFRVSRCLGNDSIDPYAFRGDVLLSRYPTTLPSDIRKVTAVVRNELSSYVDVIVCPIKGRRSLASWLSGGDYDGDRGTVIAHPALVEPFLNSELVQEPPNFQRDNFMKDIESVPNFLRRIYSSESPSLSLLKTILLGLSDSKIGLYSNFHDSAMFQKGYSNPETIRLAFMYTTCLDAGKTGLRVKTEVFRKDRSKYDVPLPDYVHKGSKTSRELGIDTNMPNARRPPNLGPFVLEILHIAGIALQGAMLQKYDQLKDKVLHRRDADLAQPFEDYKRRRSFFMDKYSFQEEDLIQEHVKRIYEQYRASLQRSKRDTTKTRTSVVSKLASDFTSTPLHSDLLSSEEIPIVRASYAYVLTADSRSKELDRSFPFDMAHRELCFLKARASERMVSMKSEFHDIQMPHSSLFKSCTPAQ